MQTIGVALMQYEKFVIQNFKGIEHAEVDLRSEQARVTTLVGLNESGKTTVLEAIHSFAPDMAADTMVGRTTSSSESRTSAVPRSKLSNFTGDVSIAAHVILEDGDKDSISEKLLEYGLHIDLAQVPDRFVYKRYSKYDNGALVGNYFNIDFDPFLTQSRQESSKQARERT